MYMQHLPSGTSQGQGSGSISSPHHSNPIHQYPFTFDPSYSGSQAVGTGNGAGPSNSASPSTSMNQAPSYDYSYSRSQHDLTHQGQGMGMSTGFPNGMDDQGGWGTNTNGGGMYGASASASTSQERSTSQQHSTQQSVWPPQSYNLESSSSSPYPYGTAESWAQRGKPMSNAQWPDEYVEPIGPERELSALQMTLSDLVESIRPHASSSSNPRPSRPSPYLQARFLRLATTVQTSLSNLQPHLHQTLHPQFMHLPPSLSRNLAQGVGTGTSMGDPNGTGTGTGGEKAGGGAMTAAEKEMEVIRKRRDMLIARAAQVQASSQPSAVHQSQLPVNWNHGELYQNGGGIYGSPAAAGPGSGSNNTNPSNPINNNGLALFTSHPLFSNLSTTDSPSLNSSSRSNITLDNFDASLARFSLDPTKIGQNGYITGMGHGSPSDSGLGGKVKVATASDGARCHGCGASVTPEWRMGPDGPRSLCNACGLHYAKITKRRAQEGANVNVNVDPQANGFPQPVATSVGF